MQRLWGVDCERCKNALDALAEKNLLRLKLGTIRLWDAIPFGRWTRLLLRAWHVLTSISSKETKGPSEALIQARWCASFTSIPRKLA